MVNVFPNVKANEKKKKKPSIQDQASSFWEGWESDIRDLNTHPSLKK